MAIPTTIVVFVLSEWIVLMLAGKEYLDSVVILQVSLLMALLLPFLKQFGTVIDALNKPKKNFLLMMTGFFVNIVVNYFLINYFGVIGAAYATLITYIMLVIAAQVILVKELNVSQLSILKNIPEAYKRLWLLLFDRK